MWRRMSHRILDFSKFSATRVAVPVASIVSIQACGGADSPGLYVDTGSPGSACIEGMGRYHIGPFADQSLVSLYQSAVTAWCNALDEIANSSSSAALQSASNDKA